MPVARATGSVLVVSSDPEDLAKLQTVSGPVNRRICAVRSCQEAAVVLRGTASGSMTSRGMIPCGMLSRSGVPCGVFPSGILPGNDRIPVVVTEARLPDGSWKDIRRHVARLPDAPRLIVISADADDSAWAEVLNAGGYGVLQKPLDAVEAVSVLKLACQSWLSEREREGRIDRRHGCSFSGRGPASPLLRPEADRAPFADQRAGARFSVSSM